MERRQFIALIGGAAGWSLAARAQQGTTPIIGFLHAGSPEQNNELAAAFRKGLSEIGYVEGQNVAIEYRWAEGQDSRLPELVADLIRRQVAVIATPGSTQAALVAKAATKTIPIVFSTGGDPVALGLVANRPGGNVTGIVNLSAELSAKRLGLLREFAPRATRLAALVNPQGPLTAATLKDLEAEAPQLGQLVEILYADTPGKIDAAISKLAERVGAALMVGTDALFTNRRVQIVALAAQYGMPAIYPLREFAEIGGLMSYGPNFASTYRQVGVYAGRILQGAKPTELPVVQPTKFELVINLKTAKTLGLKAPDKLLATADEVIE